MENLSKWWEEFYSNNPELTLILVGALGGAISTAIFSKLLPSIWAAIVSFIAFIGAKIGGRLGYKYIQNIYLNWVVMANQELNLTGFIGSDQKPKLEQIFISLKVSSQSETRNKGGVKSDNLEDMEEDELTYLQTISTVSKPIFKRIFSLLIMYSRWIIEKISPKLQMDNLTIFKSSRIWRLHQYQERNLYSYILVLFFLFLPVLGFIILPDINNIFAALGIIIWGLIDLAMIVQYFEDKESLSAYILYAILPHATIIYGLSRNIIIKNNLPWIIVGAILILITSMFVILYAKYLGKRRETHDDYTSTAEEISKILSKEHVAILGKPGSGKSTYLQFIALTFAQEKAGDKILRNRGITKKRFGITKWYLPIFIPLRMVARFISESNIDTSENLLMEAFNQQVLPSHISSVFSKAYIHHMLQNKKCVFLLDGIDEVADDNEFRFIVNEIRGLISRYPGNKIIVTSRYSGWRGGIGASFEQLDVNDMNEYEIANFIDKWCQSIEENRARISGLPNTTANRQHKKHQAMEIANNLKLALSRNISMLQLAENPLLLSIVCYVHYQKILPEERTSLYDKCSELLLDLWDRKKGLTFDHTNLTPARKVAILEEIAFALHSGKIGSAYGRKEFAEVEVIPIVQSMLIEFRMDSANAAELFMKLVDRSGIIVCVEQFDKYAFSHLTFQEYFAAKYLNDKHLDIFETVERVANDSPSKITTWWREVLLLYSAMQRDASWIINKLSNIGELDLPKKICRLLLNVS